MADVQAGKRYAQAAFAIARDGGTIAAWRSDLRDVATVLVDSGVAPILADGKRPLAERLAVLDQVLDVQPGALNLAKLLVQKGRSGDASAVARAFQQMADEHDNVAGATVTTAVELSPDQLSEIETHLSQTLSKRVHATARVDPAIVGGVVVRVGDKLLDGSVRTRLHLLRRELQASS